MANRIVRLGPPIGQPDHRQTETDEYTEDEALKRLSAEERALCKMTGQSARSMLAYKQAKAAQEKATSKADKDAIEAALIDIPKPDAGPSLFHSFRK